MKPFFFAFFFICSACLSFGAASEDDPEQQVLGTWKRAAQVAGIQSPMADLVFNKDHTCGDNEDNSYTWAYKDGRYIVREEPLDDDEERGMEGKIDASGVLELKYEDVKWTLWRENASNPTKTGEAPKPEDLQGEWQLAYVRNSMYSTAPVYDMLSFSGSMVKLKSSYVPKEIESGFSLDGDQCVVGPFGIMSNPLTFRIEDDKQRLVISPKHRDFGLTNADWVYLRPEKFLNEELKDTWVCKHPEAESYFMETQFDPQMHFKRRVVSSDGKVMNESAGSQYYRRWTLGDRQMITFMEAPEAMIGLQAHAVECKIDGDKLEIIPVEISLRGEITPVEEAKIVMTLKK